VRVDKTVVVGGGIIGLCSALALQRAGLPTILLAPERGSAPASFGNAGHIAIEQAEPLASWQTIRSAPRRLTIAGGALGLPPGQIRHWLPFALRLARAAAPTRYADGKAALSVLLAEAMPAWQRLAGSLPRRDLLIERGHIVVWHDPRAAERGLAAWRRTDIGTARFRPASTGECRDLGQAMARPPAGAIIFDNTAQVVDPGIVSAMLEQAFVAAGGERRIGRVRRLALAGTEAVLTTETGDTLQPRALLIAAGVESGALFRPLGIRVPIIAERGYHIQAAGHRWPDLPPVVFEERSMIVTRFESGLRAASFVEFGTLAAPPDPRRWQRLEHHVADLGLPVATPFTRWMGARPTLPDYLPAIGRVRQATNLFYAFGHQHLGMTLGPVTGELVAALLAGQPTTLPLGPYALDRFG
jgi:glycine/D-amino acid oxidase-like deaminating enzyme